MTKVEMPKKKILILTDWFAPGFKAGGPIRSCVNFVEHMSTDYQVYVYTGDRDLGDSTPYPGVQPDKWIKQPNGVQIYYVSPERLNWKAILQVIKNSNCDYVYLNSMYSKFFTIYPLLMKRLQLIKPVLVLSPRGMLKQSALYFKAVKKRAFLNVFKILGLHKHTRFHATDATEVTDIYRCFGNTVAVTNIANYPGFQKEFRQIEEKEIGKLKMIFVGRVHPIKNLHLLLQSLKEIRSKVELTIVAVLEDVEYWALCKRLIETFPENIRVTMLGNVPNSKLEQVLLENHLFCLPTQGENFGHAIFEALAAGRPVLISDQTPWRNLEKERAGWDLPLNNMDAFTKVIEMAAKMNIDEMGEWSEAAWQFCHAYIEQSDIKQQYNKLFN